MSLTHSIFVFERLQWNDFVTIIWKK